MATQERTHKRTESPARGADGQAKAQVAEKGQQLKDDLDELIDAIDDVLEENAEEFLKGFVQRGGE